MKRYKIGIKYWKWLNSEPFAYCLVNAHNDNDALSRAHSVLSPSHMQCLTIMEPPIEHVQFWNYGVVKKPQANAGVDNR
jgi:hypothetical protein